jgi:hypothetical protein
VLEYTVPRTSAAQITLPVEMRYGTTTDYSTISLAVTSELDGKALSQSLVGATKTVNMNDTLSFELYYPNGDPVTSGTFTAILSGTNVTAQAITLTRVGNNWFGSGIDLGSSAAVVDIEVTGTDASGNDLRLLFEGVRYSPTPGLTAEQVQQQLEQIKAQGAQQLDEGLLVGGAGAITAIVLIAFIYWHMKGRGRKHAALEQMYVDMLIKKRFIPIELTEAKLSAAKRQITPEDYNDLNADLNKKERDLSEDIAVFEQENKFSEAAKARLGEKADAIVSASKGNMQETILRDIENREYLRQVQEMKEGGTPQKLIVARVFGKYPDDTSRIRELLDRGGVQYNEADIYDFLRKRYPAYIDFARKNAKKMTEEQVRAAFRKKGLKEITINDIIALARRG